MKQTLLLISLLLYELLTTLVKSQSSSIQIQGKSVNAFTIELTQQLEYVKELFNLNFEIECIGTPVKTE